MSGFSGGGGPIFAAAANADAVLALIKLMADPDTYEERVTMLRDLEQKAHETQQAAQALSEESAKQKTELEAARLQLHADTERHTKAVADFGERSNQVSADLMTREANLAEQQNKLAGEREEFEQAFVFRADELEERQKRISFKETELREREATLALKEASVAAKMSKIREIEQAG